MLYESLNNNPGDPAQHSTHASAWEIWIFEIEKSTGECNSWEISWNSKFLKIYDFLRFQGSNFHSWRDLMPRDGSRSIWDEISKNINFFLIWSFLTCSYVESSCILCSLFKSIPGLKLRCQVAARYIQNILIWYQIIFATLGEQAWRNQFFMILDQICRASLFSGTH